MKRWLAPCILLVFVLGVLVGGIIMAQQRQEEDTISPQKGELIVYTDIPNQVTSVLADEYMKEKNIKLTVLPLTEEQMSKRLSSAMADQSGDIVITSQDNLELGVKSHQFTPVISEGIDEVADRFKNTDGQWVGVWYDPVIFAQSNAFYQREGKYVTTWSTLAKPGDWKVILTDFVASRSAATILYNFVEIYGKEEAIDYFIRLKTHVIQHSKFLTTPVRLASLGETDIGIGNYSDGNQYMMHNYPVKIIFPKDGSPYTLTGAGVLHTTKNKELAMECINWLLSKQTAQLLNDNNFKFCFTNPEMPLPVDSLGHELVLLPVSGHYTSEGKKELLDAWISQVRFRKD